MEEKAYTREQIGIGNRFPRAWKIGMGTLTVAATLSLAACGGGNNGGNGGGKKSSGGSGKSSGGAAVSSSGGSTAGGSTMMGGGSTMTGSTGMMGGSTMMGGGSTMMGGGSTMMGSTGMSGGKITSIQPLLNTKTPRSLVGKKVRLSGVRVQNVVSNTAFTVGGPGLGKQVPAVLIREVTGMSDKAVNINKGQKVMLVGTVRKIPKAKAALNKFGLTKVPGLNGEQLFIAVHRVKVTGR